MKRFLLMLGLVALGAAPAMAQPACPADFQNQSAPMTCRCAPEATMGGTVWGSGTYTTDSRICRAAVHAGAIQAGGGGVVVVTPAPGQQAYQGSGANGVTTSSYGPWTASFSVAAPAAAAAACPATFDNQTAPLTCSCTAEAAASGTVWGSGTYTADSRICRAALHAAAIPASGGTVIVMPEPGLQAYEANVANGVTTSHYGPWGASFTVAAAGAAPAGVASLGACPADFEGRSAPLTCSCAAEAAASGSVWGSGPYTSDSRVCRAAVHAGVIPPTGGTVSLQPAPGRQNYAGSAANGITTSDYGAWGGSFTFQSRK